MDSVTSGGSLQSSSGEADDFTTTAATADSLSAIFRHSSGTTAAAVPLPPSIDHHHARRFFDPISYLDSISSISPPPSWPPPPLPRPSPPPRVALSSPDATTFSISSPPVQPPDPIAAPASDVGPRSSKKRSRASRRAQTTVLTTDTSNFRAMVQQFTGIPSLPFDLAGATASSSPFGRSHFGLFRSSSASSFSPLPSLPPPLLLRPFPLKTSTGVAASRTAAYSSSSPPSATIGIDAANSAINGDRNASTQSPMLTLQSLLHDMPTFVRTAKSTAETPTELGSSGLWLPTPEHMAGGDARSSWPAKGSAQSRPEICASSQQGSSSCKMNYMASPPDSSLAPEFNADKEVAAPAPAPAASMGEDIIDSWIFSSD